LGIPPTHEVLFLQIRTYSRNGLRNAAQAVFADMRNRKIVPDSRLYTHMIAHAAEINDTEKCEQYFEGTFCFFLVLRGFCVIVFADMNNLDIEPSNKIRLIMLTQRLQSNKFDQCLSLYASMFETSFLSPSSYYLSF